jgi:dTDP-4-dehydrorhamnose reductase
MKVLIVGAGGLLGRRLVQSLQGKAELFLPPGPRTATEGHGVDFTVPEQCGSALAAMRPDFVVNLAALADVDECQRDPASAFALNAVIPRNIQQGLKRAGLQSARVIQISTDQLYDSETPSTETEERPGNIYSLTKLTGEAYLPDALILRTNFTGISLTSSRTSFTDWIHRKLSAGETVPLFGDSYFSILSIQTLCELIAHSFGAFRAGVFNAGSEGVISRHRFGMEFAKACGLRSELISETRLSDAALFAPRPRFMGMDSGKLQRELGFQMPAMEQTIEILAKEYERNEQK